MVSIAGHDLPPKIAQATTLGAVPSSEVISLSVALKPRDLAGLERFVDDVSNPNSDNYRQFITPSEIGARFGASAADQKAVVSYLKSKGLTVVLTAKNGMGLLVKGSPAQVQSAFGTTLKKLKGPDMRGNVVTYRSNTTPIKVPSSIAPVVLDVSGLDTFPRREPRANTQTLSPFLARSLYKSQQFYLDDYKGQGRVIGISNFDGYRLSNVPLFYTKFGLTAPAGGAGSNIEVIPVGSPAGPGPAGVEGDLDIQMALSATPLATLLIYDGSNDLLAVVTQEADDNAADVISESYGWILPGATATAVHNQHVAMNAQGQTYLYASGDSGTTIEPFSYGNYDPEVLMVGGTVATVDSLGNRVSEVGWDGSGGGWSTNAAAFNKLPAYQKGTGVPTNINFRLSPDVALQAGGPGAFYLYYSGSLFTVDGTSCASPWFASGLLQVENHLDQDGVPFRLGRINDLIYTINGDPAVFHDITQGANGTLPNGNSSTAGTKWDFVTGFGVPLFSGLYDAISATTTPPTPVLPDSVATVVGTNSGGDVTSLGTADGSTYDVDSAQVPQFGTAAGIDATFTVPSGTTRLSVTYESRGSEKGGTNMIWIKNFSTGNFDLLPASALTDTLPAKAVKAKIQANIPHYIDASQHVVVRLRGHYPVRPLLGFSPSAFTFKVDMINLLAQ